MIQEREKARREQQEVGKKTKEQENKIDNEQYKNGKNTQHIK